MIFETNESHQRSFRRKGVKQKWLAEKLAKSYNMVNSYIHNRRWPSLDLLNRIEEILDINIRQLILSNKSSQNQ